MNKLQKFIHEFTEEEPQFIRVKKEYFLNNPLLIETIKKIDLPCFSYGLPFGTQDEGKFKPSLALLELMSKSSDRKIFLNSENLEWLFLCKRDIFSECDDTSKGLVLVQNKNDENLGLGLVNKRRKEIKNLFDRGDFIRREF